MEAQQPIQLEPQNHIQSKSKPYKVTVSGLNKYENWEGDLIELKDSSIILSNFNKGTYEIAELYIDDIYQIGKEPRGIGRGFLIGAGYGAAIGAVFGMIVLRNSILGAPGNALVGAVIVMPIGAVIGGISASIRFPIYGSIDKYNRKKKKLGRYTVKYDGSPTY